MFVAHGTWEDGWSEGEMMDFQPLTLTPAACVLNYGQGLFEGMKARMAPVSYTHLTLPTIYSV